MSNNKTTIQVDETTKQVFQEFQQIISQGFNDALNTVVESELQEKLKAIHKQMQEANSAFEKIICKYNDGAGFVTTFINSQTEKTSGIAAGLEELKKVGNAYLPIFEEVNKKLGAVEGNINSISTIQNSLKDSLPQHIAEIKAITEKYGKQNQESIAKGTKSIEEANSTLKELQSSLKSVVTESSQKLNDVSDKIASGEAAITKLLNTISITQTSNASLLQTVSSAVESVGNKVDSKYEELSTKLTTFSETINTNHSESLNRFQELNENQKSIKVRLVAFEEWQNSIADMLRNSAQQVNNILQIQTEIQKWQKLPWYKKLFIRS